MSEGSGCGASEWTGGSLKVALERKPHGEHELEQSAKAPRKESEAQRPASQTKGVPGGAGRSRSRRPDAGGDSETSGNAGASVHTVPFGLTWFQLSFATQCLEEHVREKTCLGSC